MGCNVFYVYRCIYFPIGTSCQSENIYGVFKCFCISVGQNLLFTSLQISNEPHFKLFCRFQCIFFEKNRLKQVCIYLFTKFAAEYNVSGCLSPFLWKIISVCYSVMHIGTQEISKQALKHELQRTFTISWTLLVVFLSFSYGCNVDRSRPRVVSVG